MAWQTPVTNWTAQNYFNYFDWNRIENNIVALQAMLLKQGFDFNLTTITWRTDGSFLDFYDSLNNIEGNILSLYSAYGIAPSGWVIPVTSWTYDMPFSYVDTNRMEGNLLALYNLIGGSIAELVFCGQSLAICGLGWYN